jgi:hypothetical protein
VGLAKRPVCETALSGNYRLEIRKAGGGQANLGFLARRWSDQPSDRLVRRRVRLGSVCSPGALAGERVGIALSEAEQVGTMRWFPVIADGAGRYVAHLVIEVNHYA